MPLFEFLFPLEIPWPDPPIITAIIAAVGLGFGAWLTWVAAGASRLQARVESLETRMKSLEDEKTDLLRNLSAATSFINRIGLWLLNKKETPAPVPPEQIHAHIDTELWPNNHD